MATREEPDRGMLSAWQFDGTAWTETQIGSAEWDEAYFDSKGQEKKIHHFRHDGFEDHARRIESARN